MNTETETNRREFEEWAESKNFSLPKGNRYISPATEIAWEAWQAAREQVTEQCDWLVGEIVGWRNKWECAVEIAAQAEVKRDILVKSIEPLKYWRDISECDCKCDCSNPLPQGGCLRCDLDRILNNQ
jgi:hypothetical protein